jgi:hypothetical protein
MRKAVERKSWILTSTGRKVFPLAPTLHSIHLIDIAHALANLCRYTGHSRFYSIAEHCVRVSYMVTRSSALAALLHDASEAYLLDFARPVKYHPKMAFYRAAEDKLQRMIFKRFGLDPDAPFAVHAADNRILGTEARRLFRKIHRDWNVRQYGPTVRKPSGFPWDWSEWGWDPATAKQRYLQRFKELTR